MSIQAAVEKLQAKFGGSVLEVKEFRGETTVIVKKEDVVAICTCLKAECGFNLRIDNGEISFGRVIGQSHK